MAIPVGYTQVHNGFWYKTSDNSGPYALKDDGTLVLIGGGGAGAAATQVQGTTARDSAFVGNPVVVGGVGSAAAPAAVSEGDAVSAWYLLNGSQVSQLQAAGALIGGDAANGLDVDVTRLPSTPLLATSDLTATRINTAGAGDTAIVAAVAGQTTRVHALRLSVAGAVIVQIKTGATVQEVFNFAGNGGSVNLNFNERPYWKTAVNEAININLSAAIQVDGAIQTVTSA